MWFKSIDSMSPIPYGDCFAHCYQGILVYEHKSLPKTYNRPSKIWRKFVPVEIYMKERWFLEARVGSIDSFYEWLLLVASSYRLKGLGPSNNAGINEIHTLSSLELRTIWGLLFSKARLQYQADKSRGLVRIKLKLSKTWALNMAKTSNSH